LGFVKQGPGSAGLQARRRPAGGADYSAVGDGSADDLDTLPVTQAFATRLPVG
jgi:hypothetical protein